MMFLIAQRSNFSDNHNAKAAKIKRLSLSIMNWAQSIIKFVMGGSHPTLMELEDRLTANPNAAELKSIIKGIWTHIQYHGMKSDDANMYSYCVKRTDIDLFSGVRDDEALKQRTIAMWLRLVKELK